MKRRLPSLRKPARLKVANQPKPIGGGGVRIVRSASGAPCARTTVPTATPGIISPTTRAAAGYPLGRRRTGGIMQSNAGCDRVLCGNGRDRSKGSAMWTDQPGGQSRRGRQGVANTISKPAHASYRRCLKRPQRSSYDGLARRLAGGPGSREFECSTRGIFDEGRYFDVVVEYTPKRPPDDT